MNPVETLQSEKLELAEMYRELIQDWLVLGNLEKAKFCFQKLDKLITDFDINATILEMAEQFNQANEVSSAINCYRLGIVIKPNFCWFYHQLGEALSRQGKVDETIQSVHKCLSLVPDYSISYKHIWKTLDNLNLLEQAITYCQKCIRSLQATENLSAAIYYNLIGEMLQRRGMLTQAFEYHEKAYATYPKLAAAISNLAEAKAGRKEVDDAIELYETLIQANSKFSWSYYFLGNLLAQKLRFADAIQAYRSCISLSPEVSVFHQKLGETLLKQGDLDEAIYHCQIAVELDPKSPELYFILGVANTHKKNWDKAIYHLMQALKMKPNHIVTYHQLGEIFLQQKKFDEAETCFQAKLPNCLIQSFFGQQQEKLTTTTNAQTDQITRIEVSAIPASAYKLLPPKTIDGKVHSMMQKTVVQTTGAFLTFLPEGRSWQDGLNSVVFTANNQPLRDLSRGNVELITSALENLPRALHIEGNALLLACPSGQIFCHWLLDTLPRLEVLRASGISLETIDAFVVNEYKLPFHIEALDLLGVPQHKIIETASHPHIVAEKLVAPSLTRVAGAPSKWTCDFLRREFLMRATSIDSDIEPLERVYISRKKASYRHVMNESEVETFLEKYNFHSISLEDYSIREAAFLLSKAKAIIAPHGAGLTQIVFCQPGTKVIEIFASHMYIDYWAISNIYGYDYYYLQSNFYDSTDITSADQFKTFQQRNKEDIWVNINQLLNLMERAQLT